MSRSIFHIKRLASSYTTVSENFLAVSMISSTGVGGCDLNSNFLWHHTSGNQHHTANPDKIRTAFVIAFSLYSIKASIRISVQLPTFSLFLVIHLDKGNHTVTIVNKKGIFGVFQNHQIIFLNLNLLLTTFSRFPQKIRIKLNVQPCGYQWKFFYIHLF